MTRAVALLLVLAMVAAACGRRGDPERPPGAYADPAGRIDVERTSDEDPVPDPLTPGAAGDLSDLE